ncbi:gas vesicle protein [Sinomonas gamaensis]|uniref:gas vesicle protein n=1 Tax=Sinomonas gamaensis TaxID=2565624 RepID=UPI001109F922|nr:gas vesicle protein [Sinomonas gamaensis]
MTELREPEGTASREATRPSSSARALTPTRDREATLAALVDSLLNKGVYLDLDAVITVAGIPLIGLSLRAALAGMETLLEYGMFEDWDERTRAWARRLAPAGLDLADDEEIVARMPGAYRLDLTPPVWQPGTVFLTDRRLLVYRSEPAAMLWQAPRARVTHVGKVSERGVGGKDVPRLLVTTDDGGLAHLTAARPDRLRNLLLRGLRGASSAVADVRASDLSSAEAAGTEEATEQEDAELWVVERRASGSAWRRGEGRIDDDGFHWKGDGDRRPAVRIAPSDVLEIRRGEREGEPEGLLAFVVVTPDGETRFAAAPAADWQARLQKMATGHAAGGEAK